MRYIYAVMISIDADDGVISMTGHRADDASLAAAEAEQGKPPRIAGLDLTGVCLCNVEDALIKGLSHMADHILPVIEKDAYGDESGDCHGHDH